MLKPRLGCVRIVVEFSVVHAVLFFFCWILVRSESLRLLNRDRFAAGSRSIRGWIAAFSKVKLQLYLKNYTSLCLKKKIRLVLDWLNRSSGHACDYDWTVIAPWLTKILESNNFLYADSIIWMGLVQWLDILLLLVTFIVPFQVPVFEKAKFSKRI